MGRQENENNRRIEKNREKKREREREKEREREREREKIERGQPVSYTISFSNPFHLYVVGISRCELM